MHRDAMQYSDNDTDVRTLGHRDPDISIEARA